MSPSPLTCPRFETLCGQEWEKLYLVEGGAKSDDGLDYPMPSAHGTRDLLHGLKSVKGRAVHTNPGTTVSEGMGYAMLVAGMRKDIPSLKSFVVGWQAMGQGVEGQHACGGCCASATNGHSPPAQICAAHPTEGSLCRRVPGAYMPAWQLPMVDGGSMGSATDGDEDAVTGLCTGRPNIPSLVCVCGFALPSFAC